LTRSAQIFPVFFVIACGVKAAVESVGPPKRPIVKGITEKCQKEYLDVRL
jgi:hypothetical protein